MNYNIIMQYTDYITKSFLNYFKILFNSKFKKDLTLSFIDLYINVRYYNETNYINIKDFTSRLNKEFIDLIESIGTEDNIQYLKNIVAAFGYLTYFDDLNYVYEEVEVIDALIGDKIVKLEDNKDLKNELKNWLSEFKKGKEVFNDTLNTKYFNLIEDRLYRKLYSLTLTHDVKISNLYSEYAVDRAYNTGIINEDKLFITYIQASLLALNNAINLDFSKHYMLPFASSLFEKEKKFTRLINTINNPLAKKILSIKLNYQDYMKHQSKINELINQGYVFGLELDSKYTGNVTELLLFPYILVYEDSEEYEMLIREKEHLKSRIIKL